MHDSLMLCIFATNTPSITTSTSTSSNTTNNTLPPNSIEIHSNQTTAYFISVLPTNVDPMNNILRNRKSSISGSTTQLTKLLMMTLSTPHNTPTSINKPASTSIDNNVC